MARPSTMDIFPVFKLPTEIRLMVWTALVVSDGPIPLDLVLDPTTDEAACIPRRRWNRRRLLQSSGTCENPCKVDRRRLCRRGQGGNVLDIALTCHQIRDEVTPIYYSKNSFHLTIRFWNYVSRQHRPLLIQALRPFIDDIGKESFFRIKHMGVNLATGSKTYNHLEEDKRTTGPKAIHCLLAELQDFLVGQQQEIPFYQEGKLAMILKPDRAGLVVAAAGARQYSMDYERSKQHVARRISSRRRQIEEAREKAIRGWALDHAVWKWLMLEDRSILSEDDQSRILRNLTWP